MLTATGFNINTLPRPFILAIASGKGGTGKTTLSLALALNESTNRPVSLLDCDSEEPNGAIFLKNMLKDITPREEEVSIPVPIVDEKRCTACGACVRACEFNAIVLLKTSISVFNELCHGCGACTLACPEQAIGEEPLKIGLLKDWQMPNLRFIEGEMDVGVAMSPPIIKAVIKRGKNDAFGNLLILDSPPGTSCPMVSTVRNAHFVVLVTEPTPFGLHDLGLAVSLVRQLGLPFGVVINRSDSGDGRVKAYCQNEGIPLLVEIPQDRNIAVAISKGQSLLDAGKNYVKKMQELLDAVYREYAKSGNEK